MHNLDFDADDVAGRKPDLTVVGRRYRHEATGKEYMIGGWSFDADRQRWLIGYRQAGGIVVFHRLPEEFFARVRGKWRFEPIQ